MKFDDEIKGLVSSRKSYFTKVTEMLIQENSNFHQVENNMLL